MKITTSIKFEWVRQFKGHRPTEKTTKLIITNLLKADNARKYDSRFI